MHANPKSLIMREPPGAAIGRAMGRTSTEHPGMSSVTWTSLTMAQVPGVRERDARPSCCCLPRLQRGLRCRDMGGVRREGGTNSQGRKLALLRCQRAERLALSCSGVQRQLTAQCCSVSLGVARECSAGRAVSRIAIVILPCTS